MSPAEHALAFEQRLRPLGNAERAQAMQAYLLHQFAFLGLPAPVRRAAVKDLSRHAPANAADLLETAERLWRLPEREFRYTAIDLLRQHHRLLGLAHLPPLQALLVREAWWETVDGLGAVVNLLLRAERRRHPQAQAAMDAWLADANFWVRRTAMLHQLGWRLDTDSARLIAYARRLAPESEFFIRKAIGWALRDYARWNPGLVHDLLADQGVELSSLTRREAGKHLA